MRGRGQISLTHFLSHSSATRVRSLLPALQQSQKHAFGKSRHGEGEYTWSGGRTGVGRKTFHKGWKHLTPRKPHNLQERWHRAAVDRMMDPRIIENYATSTTGDRDTLEWRMHYRTTALDMSPKATDDLKRLSPWHDIPLGFVCTKSKQLLFNFVNEIPKGERAKMECATDEEWNPIKQDTKKGKLRYFKYGDLPFNYGFIPQTWEDPSHKSAYSDNPDLTGDNDPVDVVEISNKPIEQGQIIPTKVLGVIGLIDEGETDWKIIALRADHSEADKIENIEDASRVLGTDFEALIVDWFRNYKVPDGKPQNEFTHDAKTQSAEMAVKVIEECHFQWHALLLGATDSDLSKDSVTHRHMIATGLTSNSELSELPRIQYPKFDEWNTKIGEKMDDVDFAYEEYELMEEAPDQRKK